MRIFCSRYTHSEKRYHSEVRQEAVQQALAAMQGKNANKVPLPSKRSSVTRTTAKDDEDEETGKRREGWNRQGPHP